MRRQMGDYLFSSEVELSSHKNFETTIQVTQPGFVEMDLKARSDSDWSMKDAESAVLRISVNDAYNQDCVLFYGKKTFNYQRMLGSFDPGTYKIRIEFQEEVSSPLVEKAWVNAISFSERTMDDSLSLVYKHTPIFYGRNLYTSFDSRYTDTPLVLLYHIEKSEATTTIEYHMVFSHEDEGTPGPALMSKWGRTTDIEWAYRVMVNQDGEIEQAVFQGPHHKTTSFNGGFDLGGHPVLQVATANGNVNDQVTSAHRFLLPPLFEWKKESEPRERVMDQFHFTYQVSAWEMQRQEHLESPVNPHSVALANARHYLFLQTHTIPENVGEKVFVDLQVNLKGSDVWHSSSFHDYRIGHFRAVYDGPYRHYQTTIKWPEGTKKEDIEEIRAVWLSGGTQKAFVETVRAFSLDTDYLPTMLMESKAQGYVSEINPHLTLWKATSFDDV